MKPKQHLIYCKTICMDESCLQTLKTALELLETLENELTAIADKDDDDYSYLRSSCSTANDALYDFLDEYYHEAYGAN